MGEGGHTKDTIIGPLPDNEIRIKIGIKGRIWGMDNGYSKDTPIG